MRGKEKDRVVVFRTLIWCTAKVYHIVSASFVHDIDPFPPTPQPPKLFMTVHIRETLHQHVPKTFPPADNQLFKYKTQPCAMSTMIFSDLHSDLAPRICLIHYLGHLANLWHKSFRQTKRCRHFFSLFVFGLDSFQPRSGGQNLWHLSFLHLFRWIHFLWCECIANVNCELWIQRMWIRMQIPRWIFKSLPFISSETDFCKRFFSLIHLSCIKRW